MLRTRLRRWALPLGVLLFTLASALVLYQIERYQVARQLENEQEREAQAAALAAGLNDLRAELNGYERRLDSLPPLGGGDARELRRYLNPQHLRVARAQGVGRVATEDTAEELLEAGRLEKLERETAYWVVDDMTHSLPLVTPTTRAALEELGRRFHERLAQEGLPAFRFIITSALRTTEKQNELRRSNRNAARGASTHEFGTTIDIVYHRYAAPQDSVGSWTGYPEADEEIGRIRTLLLAGLANESPTGLKGELGRALRDMQQEDLLMVTLERMQPVYHTTVSSAP